MSLYLGFPSQRALDADITGTPGVDLEIKARRGLDTPPAILCLADVVALLRAAWYGLPPEEDE